MKLPRRDEREAADALDHALGRPRRGQAPTAGAESTEDVAHELASLAARLRSALAMPALPASGPAEVRAAALAMRAARRRNRARLFVAAIVTLMLGAVAGASLESALQPASPARYQRAELSLASAKKYVAAAVVASSHHEPARAAVYLDKAAKALQSSESESGLSAGAGVPAAGGRTKGAKRSPSTTLAYAATAAQEATEINSLEKLITTQSAEISYLAHSLEAAAAAVGTSKAAGNTSYHSPKANTAKSASPVRSSPLGTTTTTTTTTPSSPTTSAPPTTPATTAAPASNPGTSPPTTAKTFVTSPPVTHALTSTSTTRARSVPSSTTSTTVWTGLGPTPVVPVPTSTSTSTGTTTTTTTPGATTTTNAASSPGTGTSTTTSAPTTTVPPVTTSAPTTTTMPTTTTTSSPPEAAATTTTGGALPAGDNGPLRSVASPTTS